MRALAGRTCLAEVEAHDAAETDDGHLLTMVLEESKHRKLAGHGHTLLHHFTVRCLARATSH
ncbi:hypothetical protein ACLVWQ_28360 [Streptomyces sp. CWNU-52B]|uniref:hypothetical protein n=1 Tax=unclassified Streptomyces TaxID=2593676 RepID=UPI0039C1C440